MRSSVASIPSSYLMPPQQSAGGSRRAREGRGGRGGGAGGVSSARATAAAAAAGSSGGAQRQTGRRANAGIGQGRRGPFVYRGEFRRDVQGLMFAFGDSERPNPASLALMEDMTVSFLTGLVRRARPAPNQVALPANAAQVTSIAQADALQRQTENAQQKIDDAAARAAAGSSAAAKAQAQRRAAAAAAAEEHRRKSEMPVRAGVHPFVGRTRLTVDDIKFACRKDAKMTSRIEELIYLDKEITSARKGFEVPADEAIQENSNKTNSGPS